MGQSYIGVARVFEEREAEKIPKSLDEAVDLALEKITKAESRKSLRQMVGERYEAATAFVTKKSLDAVAMAVQRIQSVKDKFSRVGHYSKQLNRIAEELDAETRKAIARHNGKTPAILLPKLTLRPNIVAAVKGAPEISSLEDSDGYKAYAAAFDKINTSLAKKGLGLSIQFVDKNEIKGTRVTKDSIAGEAETKKPSGVFVARPEIRRLPKEAAAA